MARLCRFGSVFLLVALLLGGASLLSACSSFSSGDSQIPDSTFSQVLVELHILSARHRRGLEPPKGLRDSVFTHYGVDSTAFRETLQYYARSPDKLEPLYDRVIDTLRAIESEVKRSSRDSTSDS